MGTFQYPSGSGLRYPASGELIGIFAEFLRLKGYVRASEEISSKTAERYYRGERVAPESVESILDGLVRPILPSELVEPDVFRAGFEPAAWARDVIADLAMRWDRLATHQAGNYFPLVSPVDAPLPFLRLIVLEFGIRWGAYQALRVSLGCDPILSPPWLTSDALRVVMDEFRPESISVRELAQKGMKVSKNTMDAWRAGTSLPDEENLDGLAGVLATYSGKAKDGIKARLRLAVGVAAAWHRLALLVSHKAHIQNLAHGFETAAKRAFEFFKWLPLPLDEAGRIAALRDVVYRGARATAGVAACDHLASLCELNQEVEADLRVLPGDWADRLNYWIQWLGTQRPAAEHIARRTGRPVAEVLKTMPSVMAMAMRMAHFDSPASDLPHVVTVTGNDEFKAANRMAQAERAWSAGDYATALNHLERALELQPGDGSYHRHMGAWLGELVEAGAVEHLDRAVAELNEAVRLNASDHTAATEIGIVLCNSGLLDEAEEAFDAAEPISKHWHHFHQSRGITQAWNGKYAEAAASLRRCVELEPNAFHARRYLALVLMKLGEKKEAERVARDVEHRTRENPLVSWEKKLAHRPNTHVRWARTADGWTYE